MNTQGQQQPTLPVPTVTLMPSWDSESDELGGYSKMTRVTKWCEQHDWCDDCWYTTDKHGITVLQVDSSINGGVFSFYNYADLRDWAGY